MSGPEATVWLNALLGFLQWAQHGVLVLMQATITGVLGDFAAQVRFPYYTAVTAADVGIIQRMDLIAVAVWLVVLFVKMAFYSMLYMSCAQRIFGKNRKPLYAVAGGGTVFVTGLSFAGLAAQSEQEASVPVYLIIAGLFAVALPLVLVLADMVRERRARRARA